MNQLACWFFIRKANECSSMSLFNHLLPWTQNFTRLAKWEILLLRSWWNHDEQLGLQPFCLIGDKNTAFKPYSAKGRLWNSQACNRKQSCDWGEKKKKSSKPPSCFACKVSVRAINVFIVCRVLLISGLPVWRTFLTASSTLLLFRLPLGDEGALRGHGHGNAIKPFSPWMKSRRWWGTRGCRAAPPAPGWGI